MSVNMVDYRNLQSVQSHSHLLYRLTWDDLCNSGTGVPRVEVRGSNPQWIFRYFSCICKIYSAPTLIKS